MVWYIFSWFGFLNIHLGFLDFYHVLFDNVYFNNSIIFLYQIMMFQTRINPTGIAGVHFGGKKKEGQKMDD